MSTIRQIAAVARMNTAAMKTRARDSLVIVIGMAVLVAAALSIYSMAAGLTEMTRKTSPSPDRMAIFTGGAGDGPIQATSPVPRDIFPLVADIPGIAKGPDGKALISGVINAPFLTSRKTDGVERYISVLGVAPNILDRQPEIKIVEGRMFTPGLREMIAGKAAAARYQNTALGSTVRLQDGPWTVVGIFEGGGSQDFNLLTDADTLAAALRRNVYNVVLARLESGSPEAQNAFKAAVRSNPALKLDTESEYDYRARQVSNPTRFYTLLAYGVGAIMGLGTIFAALNCMYATVSARMREIATLRAIGFGAAAVAISVLLEVLILTVIGAVIGAAVIWGFLDGREEVFGSVLISRSITPAMMASGIGAAFAVGLIGGLFPAIRAARIPVATALQVR
ncbi:MAG: ABC transporter permease [Rhodospirillaceae bacterium]